MGVRKWKLIKRTCEERPREIHRSVGVLRTSSWVPDKEHNFPGPLDRVDWSWVSLLKAPSWWIVPDELGLGQVYMSNRKSLGDVLGYHVCSYIYQLHFFHRRIHMSFRAQLRSKNFTLLATLGTESFPLCPFPLSLQ